MVSIVMIHDLPCQSGLYMFDIMSINSGRVFFYLMENRAMPYTYKRRMDMKILIRCYARLDMPEHAVGTNLLQGASIDA